jgi:hypothetical protein
LPSLPASTSGQQFESDLRRLGNPDSAKMRPALRRSCSTIVPILASGPLAGLAYFAVSMRDGEEGSSLFQICRSPGGALQRAEMVSGSGLGIQ